MRVFVTGGTGAVGSEAVKALITAVHEVTALARTTAKASWLEDQGARAVSVSLFDETGLARLFEGHDAVVNLATAIPSTARFLLSSAWRENTKIRTRGSATVVDAALAAGVGRVIQESVCMLYPDRSDNWIDETTTPDRFPMAEGNLAAEANTARFTTAGGTGLVLRFGWFYGPGAAHSEQFYRLAKRHVAITMGRPDSYVSSIHIVDAGAAVSAALEVPAGTYNVVDDQPVTTRSFGDALARSARTGAWLRVPGRAALLLGDRTTSLTRSLRVSNRRFKAASSWTPTYRSAFEGWQATAAALDHRRSHR